MLLLLLYIYSSLLSNLRTASQSIFFNIVHLLAELFIVYIQLVLTSDEIGRK